MMEWAIEPGSITTRSAVAEIYGGATQGGIQPSARTPNILLYSDFATGRVHGYNFDGFADDGAYYYTGEGQLGDQQLRSGNRAVLQHRDQNRVLRVFEAAGPARPGGKPQRYVGAFAVDPGEPFQFRTAPDREGRERRVVVFRLLATSAVAASTAVPTNPGLAHATVVEIVQPENNVQNTFEVAAIDSREARRWEARLMTTFEAYLARQGHRPRRLSICPDGETMRMLTDTYDETTGELFEIKPTASRTHVRAAVAQLLDYRRHASSITAATVLVPSMPSTDLRDYIANVGLGLAVFCDGELIRVP